MKSSLAPGIQVITSFSRDSWYRSFILLLTFLFYTAYHLSRKPISIVKSELHRNCSNVIRPADLNITNNDTWCDWAPFDQDDYKTLFGVLDNCFLVAYAIGMFFSGIFGERLPLRYYLSFGMLSSGLFTALFGLGFYWNIHSLGYYAVIQVLNGLMQTTGWPAVVACVGNWFGKGKRGFIMGVWNSHTSVGNILGSLIAGVYVSSEWGMSFIVPGIIIASTGILCFFFLVEKPEDVNCAPPQHHSDKAEGESEPLLHSSSPVVSNGSITTDPEEVEVIERHTEAISFCGALSIPGVVEFSLCLLFAKLVSYTFLYWLPLYISNVAHFDAKEAGDMSTLFDVGGIVGGIMAGLVSDYTGGRATTCCVMLLFAAPMLFLYNHIGQRSLPTTIGMLLLCGGLVNGPYALITTAVSADLGTHESLRGNSRALSTVTAIIDGTGSVGGCRSGPTVVHLVHELTSQAGSSGECFHVSARLCCRGCAGPPAGRRHLSVRLEQRLLHADHGRHARLPVSSQAGLQGGSGLVWPSPPRQRNQGSVTLDQRLSLSRPFFNQLILHLYFISINCKYCKLDSSDALMTRHIFSLYCFVPLRVTHFGLQHVMLGWSFHIISMLYLAQRP